MLSNSLRPVLRQTVNYGRRGLASTVLLTKTREALEKRTVGELKVELRERGLSTTGRRETLITRLAEHKDYSTVASPTTSTPPTARSATITKTAAPAASPITGQTRRISTTWPVKQNGKFVDPETGKPLPKILPFSAPNVPAPIGLPGNVILPTEADVEDYRAGVPYIPEKFDSILSTSTFPTRRPPRVIHAAGDATIHHAAKEPGSAHETDLVSNEIELDSSIPQVTQSWFQNFLREIGGLFGDAMKPGVKTVYTSQEGLWQLANGGTGAVGGESGGSGSQKFKAVDRTLNAEETSGLWMLLGIVGLGLVLGGPSKPKKEHHYQHDHDHHVKDNKDGKTAVKVEFKQ